MLINIHHDSRGEHNRLLVAGLVFLLSIALLIWLSIAIYAKKFDHVTWVTIDADRAGLQLAKFGDVRLNGALVGQVREISQVGDHAEIKVALDPAEAKSIPSNVSVRIIPTTLFGQKFVQLIVPSTPASTSLTNGSVIPTSRVTTNVELSQVLANLFPLLRAVRPQDLNETLSAIATALEGRGEEIGRTMDQLGSYLGAIDGHLPTLKQDLIQLAKVSKDYDVAAPDLLHTLANLTVTSRTIVQEKADIDVFFSDLTGLSDTATRFLQANGQNLIQMSRLTVPMADLLARYSPEFPCLIKGAAAYAPILSKTFEGGWVKQFIEFFNPQYHVYRKSDAIQFGEVGHGPWCLGLPNFTVPSPNWKLKQGIQQVQNPPGDITPLSPWIPTAAIDSGTAGTAGDRQVIDAMLADRSGHQPSSYGALGSLLYGPVVRVGRKAGS
ncbi:MAG TPA: MCE family protein [Nocardioides sp.]|nr:MCE family protein [Nocardioides sp.]